MKRWISILLCLALLVTLLTGIAAATSEDGAEDAPASGDVQAQPADVEAGEDEPAEEEPADEPADEEPASKSFAEMSVEEQYAYIRALTSDEEIEAAVSTLTEEQYAALEAYAIERAQADYVPPQTVVFTDAGPFMPPVSVTVARRMMRAAAYSTGTTAGNGLELSKTATANSNGTYTIRMEAYTTGTVTTSTKTVPVDIVLVLDQSGSMAYDFNGNSTNDNESRRQYAMKRAVNNFISSVKEKYNADADHRMAIVTFGSGVTTLQGWTYVDEAGKTNLQATISGLPNSPSGSTNVAAGMTQAETLMGSGYSYDGKNTSRQKVVIVFTDGVPTTSTDFDTGVASSAITSAKNLKDNGATVYTVGIFTGANPYELYGASGFDTNSDGTVNSQWIKDTWGLFPGTDFPEADRPAGNRFLNYLSSNYPDASSLGLTRETRGLGIFHYKITYTITGNEIPASNSYYLTADNSTSLNTIFQTISNNIQTANIDLGSATVVKDTVSPYFDLPANASAVKLYTAAAKADGTFETEKTATGVTATIENGAVFVTGFDFNANFVSDKVKDDGTYGKKLIIEFTVTPKDGFLGGNDVPTNDYQKSGVYDKTGALVEQFADANTTPTVNVPIENPVFTVSDKTIYEGRPCILTDLYTLPTFTGDDAWKAAYVNISGTTGSDVTPADCTNYDVTVTYAPKTDGTNSAGTANAMGGVSKTQTATVHVLKPTVTATVHDVQKCYGETYTLGDGTNGSIMVVWEDKTSGHTDIPTAEGTAPYTADILSLAYSTDAFAGKSGTVPKRDFDVTVKVMKGNDEITDATITTTCGVAESGCTTPDTDKTYTVHVQTCQLTVTKTGGADGEPYVFTIKKDGTAYTEVTVVGNSSEIIYELPVGTYTIVEDTGWSWRFKNPSYSEDVTLSNINPSGAITCTNSSNNNKWLNGFSTVMKNIFGVSTVVEGGD